MKLPEDKVRNPESNSTDTIRKDVRNVVEEWRKRADTMEELIDDPNERQQLVMSDFRARANELEARVLNDS